MADLTKATLSADSIQRTGLAALAQPLASSALLGDKLQIAPGLLNPGLIGAIDTGALRPRPLATLEHVQPGELITATLMNAIIDRLNALANTGAGVLALAGDVTGAPSQTVVERFRGMPLAIQTPGEGQVLGFANGAWRPTTLPTQSGPRVVAAGRLVGSHPQGTSTLTVVSSYLGNLVVNERRYIRFDGFDSASNDYFVQVTFFQAGDTYPTPVLESISDKGITLTFFDQTRKWVDLGDHSQIDIQVTAHPRTKLFNVLPGLLASGLLTLNPAVLAAINAGATEVNPATVTSAQPALTLTPDVLNTLNAALLASSTPVATSAVTSVSSAPASGLALTQPGAIGGGAASAVGIAAPAMVSTAPAAVAANNLRSMPAKKAPARKPAAKRSASKKTTPKGA